MKMTDCQCANAGPLADFQKFVGNIRMRCRLRVNGRIDMMQVIDEINTVTAAVTCPVQSDTGMILCFYGCSAKADTDTDSAGRIFPDSFEHGKSSNPLVRRSMMSREVKNINNCSVTWKTGDSISTDKS